MAEKTIVIAEAGVNHNGNLEIAEKLIDAAADADADYVKFQSFKASSIASKSAPKADYQKATTSANESQLDMLKRLELDAAAHRRLIAKCKARRIGFLSSPFDIESLDLLLSLGVDRIKVPSGEVTNLPLLRRIAAHAKAVYLSTGMCDLADIDAALTALSHGGLSKSDLVVLHCNTEYPTPLPDVNLRAMQTIRDKFNVEVGYSDHTDGHLISIAAVALGAKVIEKHFTLSKEMPGPDHRASLEPAELRLMIQSIRQIEQALGNGHKTPSPSERRNIPIARKSIVASKSIRQGDVLSEQNLTVKRPGTGLSPMIWDTVVGRVASRDFAEDELITLE